MHKIDLNKKSDVVLFAKLKVRIKALLENADKQMTLHLITLTISQATLFKIEKLKEEFEIKDVDIEVLYFTLLEDITNYQVTIEKDTQIITFHPIVSLIYDREEDKIELLLSRYFYQILE